MPIASAPREPIEPPDAVRERAPDAVAVWRNMVGGVTFRAGPRFLKWNPAGSPASLTAERDRLLWATAFHPVPEVIEYTADAEGELLVTAAIPGGSAVSERWLAEPRTAVRAIGEGLRALHEDFPSDSCPFDWGVATRIEGWNVDPGAVPEVDRIVVCHGDPCAPNTIIGDDGRWAGHVDFETLGLADRWADLAVASMSLGWNYGPDWDAEFFAAYGVAPDADRIRFYRELWNAT